jgi:hypothetical protein
MKNAISAYTLLLIVSPPQALRYKYLAVTENFTVHKVLSYHTNKKKIMFQKTLKKGISMKF